MLIELTIDRIEGDKVVLLTKDKETVIWPISKLPGEKKEGDELYFKIVDSRGEDKNLAKDILNEILDA